MNQKILIIEDDGALAPIIKDLFEIHNFKVYLVSDGIEALDLLRNTDVDVILSDIDMPRMNGLDFLKVFRKQNTSIPVIIMTGDLKRSEKEILSLGGNALIAKPFNSIEALIELISA
jgi:two-component system response regulator CpxR